MMMVERKVSLVLTTYNSGVNLENTLRSIENQDYANIEVIIKDGESTDSTLDIISEYKNNSKYPVVYTSYKDTGIYDAMNQGYALASGDYILFFNDTFTKADAITTMVSALENNTECVGCHSDLVYEKEGRIVRRWKMGEQKSIYSGWMPGHPTLLLKREVYEKYGLYKTDYRIAADYEFMVRFLNENRIAYIPETLISMYYGGTSSNGIGSYFRSFTEGNRALRENGYRLCLGISVLRTVRVLLQFRLM